jgi:hypothetical protein
MQIYREAKQLGFAPKGNSSIQRVLDRSVYAGFIYPIPHFHQPAKQQAVGIVCRFLGS